MIVINKINLMQVTLPIDKFTVYSPIGSINIDCVKRVGGQQIHLTW